MTHSGKDKKFYIEFTDASCPTNSVLVYNFATDTTKQVNNPFFGLTGLRIFPIQHYNSSSTSIRKTKFAYKTGIMTVRLL